MSKKEVWKKISTPYRERIQFSAPAHFTRNKTDDGWVFEGTDTPYYPETHVDKVIWIYADDFSPCEDQPDE